MNENMPKAAARIMDRGKREILRLADIKEWDKPQRSKIDLEKLEGLKKSIQVKGLLQPIGVNRTNKGLVIIWGSRRLRALKELEEETTEAVVFDNLTSLEARILRIAENLHQAHLTTIDEEDDINEAYKEFLVEYKTNRLDDKGQSEYAREIGISQPRLSKIIEHAEQRNAPDAPSEVKNARPSDLDVTKKLEKYPELRQRILAAMQRDPEQQKIHGLQALEARTTCEQLIETPDEYKGRVLDLVLDGKVYSGRDNKLSPLRDLVITLNNAPKELIDPLLSGALTTKQVNLLEEIEDDKVRARQLNHILGMKREQEEEAKAVEEETKKAVSKTKEDVEREESKEEEHERVEQALVAAEFDNRMVNSLYDLHVEALARIRNDHIMQVNDMVKRERCFMYVEKIREICENALKEGELIINGKFDEIIEP